MFHFNSLKNQYTSKFLWSISGNRPTDGEFQTGPKESNRESKIKPNCFNHNWKPVLEIEVIKGQVKQSKVSKANQSNNLFNHVNR